MIVFRRNLLVVAMTAAALSLPIVAEAAPGGVKGKPVTAQGGNSGKNTITDRGVGENMRSPLYWQGIVAVGGHVGHFGEGSVLPVLYPSKVSTGVLWEGITRGAPKSGPVGLAIGLEPLLLKTEDMDEVVSVIPNTGGLGFSHVSGHDPKTGELLWELPPYTGIRDSLNGITPNANVGVNIQADKDGYAYLADATRVWKIDPNPDTAPEDRVVWSAPHGSNGALNLLFVETPSGRNLVGNVFIDGTHVWFDMETGEERIRQERLPFSADRCPQPVLTTGFLLNGGELARGDVLAADVFCAATAPYKNTEEDSGGAGNQTLLSPPIPGVRDVPRYVFTYGAAIDDEGGPERAVAYDFVIDKKTGEAVDVELAWITPGARGMGATPDISFRAKEFYAQAGGGTYIYDLETGELKDVRPELTPITGAIGLPGGDLVGVRTPDDAFNGFTLGRVSMGLTEETFEWENRFPLDRAAANIPTIRSIPFLYDGTPRGTYDVPMHAGSRNVMSGDVHLGYSTWFTKLTQQLAGLGLIQFQGALGQTYDTITGAEIPSALPDELRLGSSHVVSVDSHGRYTANNLELDTIVPYYVLQANVTPIPIPGVVPRGFQIEQPLGGIELLEVDSHLNNTLWQLDGVLLWLDQALDFFDDDAEEATARFGYGNAILKLMMEGVLEEAVGNGEISQRTANLALAETDDAMRLLDDARELMLSKQPNMPNKFDMENAEDKVVRARRNVLNAIDELN